MCVLADEQVLMGSFFVIHSENELKSVINKRSAVAGVVARVSAPLKNDVSFTFLDCFTYIFYQ